MIVPAHYDSGSVLIQDITTGLGKYVLAMLIEEEFDKYRLGW